MVLASRWSVESRRLSFELLPLNPGIFLREGKETPGMDSEGKVWDEVEGAMTDDDLATVEGDAAACGREEACKPAISVLACAEWGVDREEGASCFF